ncbi:putative adenylate kinase [Mitosporidium daphniae]|uniref:Adenylate kinase isoenzyme 6 homolog n=1 Tax=Mitosporidium daphniae TaxID=1485682 RepID=A0A098VRL3_9MICR|nr:putative adenylate kinase [Mitosporidium daphniae]KGG51610.1 putative adenylate kinase [Mitosporidium daphniae]|eukprot:XP_013238037.1 putative adenylate kinase [Mitosporidium daphniae]
MARLISKLKQNPFIVNQVSQTEKDDISCKVFCEANSNGRSLPNILITGTPGTGKTTLCELVSSGDYNHINVSEEIKRNKWYSSYDEEMDSLIFSDYKVRKGLSKMISSGGNLIDFHSVANIIPSSLIDLVVVLSTNNTVLYDRLANRKYSPQKIRENIECEIMQVLLEEAHEAFKETPHIPILNLTSDCEADQNSNAERLRRVLKID